MVALAVQLCRGDRVKLRLRKGGAGEGRDMHNSRRVVHVITTAYPLRWVSMAGFGSQTTQTLQRTVVVTCRPPAICIK